MHRISTLFLKNYESMIWWKQNSYILKTHLFLTDSVTQKNNEICLNTYLIVFIY